MVNGIRSGLTGSKQGSLQIVFIILIALEI